MGRLPVGFGFDAWELDLDLDRAGGKRVLVQGGDGSMIDRAVISVFRKGLAA